MSGDTTGPLTGPAGSGADAEVERLRQRVAELTDFVSVVTHDLQEPLRSISGFGELLQRHADLAPEQVSEYLGYITDAAVRAQERVAGVAQWVRLPERPLRLSDVALREVVDDAVATASAELEEADAELTIADALPTVRGDAELLTALVRQLLANAARFRSPDRRLRIEVRGPAGEATFSVVDNGIGIPPDQRERVLGLLERLHGRSKYPGHGIGLAVALRIAEKHGGRMWVADGDSGGTSVCVALADTPEGG